jgi:hypothetical protein
MSAGAAVSPLTRWMDGYIVQLQLVPEQTTGPVRVYSLGEASYMSSDRMCVLTGLAVFWSSCFIEDVLVC